MNKGWERFFFIFSYITQGSSYMSPRVYGILHRIHHAYTDTELDPHSPSYDKNVIAMMWRTSVTYVGILRKRTEVEPRFTKNVPEFSSMQNHRGHHLHEKPQILLAYRQNDANIKLIWRIPCICYF